MGRLALILYLPLGVLGAVFAKLRPALTLSTGLAFQTSVGLATRPARNLWSRQDPSFTRGPTRRFLGSCLLYPCRRRLEE